VTRIVIAGGGIAGLEALIALRAHPIWPEPRIDLLEGATDLVERQRSVAEPFGGAESKRFDLARIAADQGAVLAPDRLRDVNPDARVVHTVRGDTIAYDALLVAVGARTDVAIPGALTFSGPRDVAAYRRLLRAVDTGRVRGVAFAVPAGIAWTLPLYELALLTADHLHANGRDDVALTVVTPERRPLDVFGPAIAARIAALLSRRRIAVRTDATPVRVTVGGLVVEDGELQAAEWIVALPRLSGPWIAGLPHDADGFIPTDAHGAVPGAEAVWAAGDGTAFPIKQGGIAAQQADAAADAIAAALGAPVDPEPFRPVMHGLLVDGSGERLLRSDADSPSAEEPWWPASKVAARHLAPYLATAEPGAAIAPGEPVDVRALLLGLAERHAVGDPKLALRCLDAAAQLSGDLPPDAARQRRELSAEVGSPRGSTPPARV
jgi:sulfide:quinone oxidoreductase